MHKKVNRLVFGCDFSLKFRMQNLCLMKNTTATIQDVSAQSVVKDRKQSFGKQTFSIKHDFGRLMKLGDEREHTRLT